MLPVRDCKVLVVSATVDRATAFVAALPTERLGFQARVVAPEGVDAALDGASWDVLLVTLPMDVSDISGVIARCTAKRPEIVSFAVSLSAPQALDDETPAPAVDGELLAAVEAGARGVLPAGQTQALAVLIERALGEATRGGRWIDRTSASSRLRARASTGSIPRAARPSSIRRRPG